MRFSLIALYIMLFGTIATAQISPGKLSFAHSKLEGISNCTKCHVLQDKVENKKCLDCHKEIKTLIDNKLGYHSSSDVKGKECVHCHGEHFGRDFKLIKFQPKKFNHDKTTFQLTGKHATLKCNECHQKKFIKSAELKKHKNTYLGLSTNCTSCHEDFHQNTFKKQECTSCHNTSAWRPAPLFNHDSAKFKLKGAHKKVKCEKCHEITKLNGKDFQKFTGLKFSKCANCHEDIHRGKFGQDCLKCHTMTSFNNVKNLKGFDHSKTGYNLEGKHKNVKCKKCHVTGYKKKLNFKNCTDCHKDEHSGQFTENGKLEDCAHCHTVQGFSPSIFTIVQHNKSHFVLKGSHLAVPCESCHLKEKKNVFRFDNANCVACHENIHGKEINKFAVNDKLCTVCHNVNSWTDVKFDHDKTEFKLLGKHKNVICTDCHFKKSSEKIFEKISTDCLSCHEDIHNGQFKKDYSNKCTACHGFENWKPVKFEHNKTKFKLDGGHKNVACTECHKSKIINGKKVIEFKFEEFSCETCHKSLQ